MAPPGVSYTPRDFIPSVTILDHVHATHAMFAAELVQRLHSTPSGESTPPFTATQLPFIKIQRHEFGLRSARLRGTRTTW